MANHLIVLRRMEVLLAQIAAASHRRPELWERSEAGTAPGGANFNLGPTRVPMGKRFVIRRVSTTAPAGTGPLAVYASASATVIDGTNLVEVVSAPQLYAGDLINTVVVRSGLMLVAVFTAAVAGTCTIRYEGDLYPENEAGDIPGAL